MSGDLLIALNLFIILLNVVVLLLFLHKLHANSEVAMTRLRLQPKKTIREFRIVVIGSVIMCVGFLMVVFSAVLGAQVFRSIGQLFGLVYALMWLLVLFLWVRRL